MPTPRPQAYHISYSCSDESCGKVQKDGAIAPRSRRLSGKALYFQSFSLQKQEKERDRAVYQENLFIFSHLACRAIFLRISS